MKNRVTLDHGRTRVALWIAIDTVLLIIAFLVSMFFHLETYSFLEQPAIWVVLISTTIATLLVFWTFGLYGFVVSYITEGVLKNISAGAIFAGMVLYTARVSFDADIPNSVTISFAFFTLFFIGGMRFVARDYFRKRSQLEKKAIIIYGAGEAGRAVISSLEFSHEYVVAALVDDDESLQNLTTAGFRVYSPRKIKQLAQQTGARSVLLAMPSISQVRRSEILNSLKKLQLEIKTVPSLSDIISGKSTFKKLSSISAGDLLGRDPVLPNPDLLSKNIAGRVVMVSGAGGSIGSELCRQILTQKPSKLILYEASEIALYSIEAELSEMAVLLSKETKIIPILGCVQNIRHLEEAIKSFNVQTIYHAAAYKHVPLVEENVVAAILNNVFGTLAITNAAEKFGVEKFILISTDKAVRPTNIMGATKRIAELICQAKTRDKTHTCFSMVRFGNVLGSSGSVIPRFEAQIEAGGPISVTHKDIKRYFMTIPEAAQLVIQAGALGTGGDVFVLDMGKAVKILDLAENLVKLHGLVPYLVDHPDEYSTEKGDIPILVTGLRKGEKLYEEILIGDKSSLTEHPRIMTATEPSMPLEPLIKNLDRLREACETYDLTEIIYILQELPLYYKSSNSVSTDL